MQDLKPRPVKGVAENWMVYFQERLRLGLMKLIHILVEAIKSHIFGKKNSNVPGIDCCSEGF